MRFSKKEEYLRQKDKKLKKIIDENGHIVFKPVKENQFDTLVGIVISQFISTKAADSIFKKIRHEFNTNYLNEKHFQQLSVNDIKKLGLSFNKAKTIKQLSNLYLNKTIDDLTELMKHANLIISRAGAGTVMELIALKKKSIFITHFKNLRGQFKGI